MSTRKFKTFARLSLSIAVIATCGALWFSGFEWLVLLTVWVLLPYALLFLATAFARNRGTATAAFIVSFLASILAIIVLANNEGFLVVANDGSISIDLISIPFFQLPAAAILLLVFYLISSTETRGAEQADGGGRENPMKALKVVLVVLGIAGIAVVAVVAYLVEDNLANKRADRAMNKPADRAMVAKVDKAVSQALATDAELTQRLGPFVRLEGSGYERLHYAFMLIERMVTSREAVFQQGTIALEIIIFCSEARDLDELPVGPISWKAPNRVTEGDFLEVSVSIDYRERYQSPEERAPWPMPLTSVELSPDTGTVFLGRMDKVEIWDRETQENVRNIEGRFGIVHDVFQETNSGPLVIDTDNRLKVVDPATGTFAGSFPSGHRVEGPRAAIGPDGRVLIQLHYSQVFVKGGPMKTEMAKVHDLENGASSTLILTGPPPAKADSVLLAPDGRHALLGAMQCWDLETETPAWTKEFSGDHSGHPLALFTPLTGRLCVYRASSSASSPEIWNTATGEVEATLELPKKTIWNDFRAVANNVFHPIMTVSPDERFLALGFDNGRVLVWNLPSGRLAGLVYNTDWKLEGSLANENQKEWQDPPSQRRGFKGIIIGKPYRGQKLAAIGFDASNRLIGVSLFPHVAWVWKTNTKGLR